jgi:signal transduction histidine kinase
VLQQKLTRKSKAYATRAGEIAGYVRDAISQTRSLARGLSPVTLESEGLASALRELAANTEKMFGRTCQVECLPKLPAIPILTATHLYRIAQEAVSNAIKHGKATEVLIHLECGGDRLLLRVIDNGLGFPKVMSRHDGMGLRIMRYRAGIIGGLLSSSRIPSAALWFPALCRCGHPLGLRILPLRPEADPSLAHNLFG